MDATFYRPVASTQTGYDVSATFCGAPFSNIAVLQDYKFCNGVDGKGVASKQLHEVLQDGGDNIYVNSMMTRQPFDFAGRTGTIVWDVDAKIFPRNDGHGWWTEMWISEDPGPLPYQQNFPSVDSVARNSFGLVFQGTNGFEGCDKAKMMNGVTAAVVSNNYNTRDLISATDMWKAPYGCFKIADSKLNHFELHINTDTAELYASDAGVPSSLRLVFRATGLNLNFTRGYVSFQHTHYNARKSPAGYNQPGTTPSQTFVGTTSVSTAPSSTHSGDMTCRCPSESPTVRARSGFRSRRRPACRCPMSTLTVRPRHTSTSTCFRRWTSLTA